MYVYRPTNAVPGLGNQLAMGVSLQAVLSWHNINALRLRDGLRAAPPRTAVVASAGGVALVLGAFARPAWQEHVTAAVDLLTGPFIVGTMGYMSRNDAYASPIFLRACAGLVATMTTVAAEPHACGLPIGPYHATLCHVATTLLFGSVAWLTVHLVERPDSPDSSFKRP